MSSVLPLPVAIQKASLCKSSGLNCASLGAYRLAVLRTSTK